MTSARIDRTILYGAPLAGKTTIIRALERQMGASLKLIYPSDPNADRGVSATWTESERTFEVATLSGAIWDLTSWRLIGPPETKVVLVLDTQASMLDLNFEFLVKGFWLGLGPIGAIQLTKADLGSPRIEGLLTNFRQCGIPCFVSRQDRPATLIAACSHVLGIPTP